MTDTNQYAERDPMELDRDGNYYCRHVSAMTAEGLHKKSDIAAELAWRDREIDRLTALSARASAGEGGVTDEMVERGTRIAYGDQPRDACGMRMRKDIRKILEGALHPQESIFTAAPQPAQVGASGGEFVLPAGWCTLAVGDGSGRLFVHGPYDAIKAAQAQILSKPPVLATPASPATGGKRHVGDSKFESWYADYCRTDWPDGTKQIARDAYAAGMGDATPQPAAAQGGDRKPWRNHDAAMDAKALATAQEIALMWGQDRSQFVSRIQVAVLDAMRWIAEGSAAPQPQEATATFLGFKITEAPGLPDGVVYVTDGKGNPLPPGAFTVPVTPPAHGDGEGDIEAAAIALANHDRKHPNARAYWDWLHDDEKAKFRSKARAVLSATRPTPEAQEARDAARYRWLRERWGRISETYMGESSQMVSIGYEEDGWEVDPTSLDDCIDAALALPAQGEGK